MSDTSYLLALADEFPELVNIIIDRVTCKMIFVLQFTCKKIRSFISGKSLGWSKDFGRDYASQGWSSLVMWSRNFGYGHDEDVTSAVATSGDLNTLKWLYENGYPYDERIVYNAAATGNLELFDWAVSKIEYKHDQVMAKAITAGHISFVRALCEREYAGQIYDNVLFGHAASGGHWDMFVFLDNSNIANGISSSEFVLDVAMWAAEYGHTDFLKKLIDYCRGKYELYKGDRVFIKLLKTVHDLEFIKWMSSVGFILSPYMYEPLVKNCRDSNNMKKIMLWIKSQGINSYNDYIIPFMARRRSLSEIKWIIKYILTDLDRTDKMWYHLNEIFAITGNIKGIEWTIKHGHFNVSVNMFVNSISGNVKLVELVYQKLIDASLDHTIDPASTQLINRYAAHNNNPEIVQFLIDHGLMYELDMCREATTFGSLEVIKLFGERCRPYVVDLCGFTLYNNNVKILRWFLHIFPELVVNALTPELFAKAAEYSSLEILHLLKSVKCPFDDKVFINAARIRPLSINMWLHKNGFPWSDAAMEAAKENDYLNVAPWTKRTFTS